MIAKLERELGTRQFQRNTREVVLTATGLALLERCAEIIGKVGDAFDCVRSLGFVQEGAVIDLRPSDRRREPVARANFFEQRATEYLKATK